MIQLSGEMCDNRRKSERSMFILFYIPLMLFFCSSKGGYLVQSLYDTRIILLETFVLTTSTNRYNKPLQNQKVREGTDRIQIVK